jgi:hypothetical protein
LNEYQSISELITDVDDYIAISGFDVPFRKGRNSHGGGIIMYHKSNINGK